MSTFGNLLRGIALPSSDLVKRIAEVLEWDVKKATDLVVADSMMKKYGATSVKTGSIDTNPELIPFIHLVPQLTKDQQKMFLEQMRAVTKMNRQR